MHETVSSGYESMERMEMYWESRGTGGVPLVALHGGFGVTTMFGDALDRLAEGRRVIAAELQGHGHTRAINHPFSYEAFGDDVAGLLEHLGLEQADLLGYSLGAGASLRCAIQHPERVRRLAVVSFPCRRDGWFPAIRAVMEQISSAGFAQMRCTPLFDAYAQVAPDPDAFPAPMDRIAELLRCPFDWSDEVGSLAMPALLVYADADSIPTAHAAEFFGLLGGGLHDAGRDGSGVSNTRLAILPGRTRYDVMQAPELVGVIERFVA